MDYLNPELPDGLKRVTVPVIDANADTLRGFGALVAHRDQIDIEIVRWPATGWRPVDTDSGDEGGTTEGVFEASWRGQVLFGRNEAVGGHYVLGYGIEPGEASEFETADPSRILMWHANYHPDGGQLFFPLDDRPYLVPLALPGDDVRPEQFVCFRCSGSEGLYIHPGVWHEGVFPTAGTQRFFDRQGAVHARVSVHFADEFGVLLELPVPGS